MNRIAIACTLLGTLSIVTLPTRAADSQWAVSVGPGFVIAPEYPGAEDEELTPVPVIDISRGRSLFLNSRRGAGAYLFTNEERQLGASVSFRRGRERHHGERIAVESIDDDAVAQLFFTQHLGRIVIDASIAQSMLEDAGLALDGSISWQFRASAATRAEIGVRGSFGDRKHMQTWFGAEHSIGTGLKSAGGFAALSHDFSSDWTVVAIVAYDTLGTDAAHSPIVQSSGMPMFALSALYHFGHRRPWQHL